jgi:hypothetical protein
MNKINYQSENFYDLWLAHSRKDTSFDYLIAHSRNLINESQTLRKEYKRVLEQAKAERAQRYNKNVF